MKAGGSRSPLDLKKDGAIMKLGFVQQEQSNGDGHTR
jgi:hypothetical protein